MHTSSSADVGAGLRRRLEECAYPGYVYGYPHKKAYRPLPAPLPLRGVWEEEDRQSLYCYVHVPFCNQRCSFCNLFTYVPGDGSPTAAYLDALAREMEGYAAALPGACFRRLYLGGGTPTYLSTAKLRRLVGCLRDALGIDPAQTAGCIEASPETIDAEKVAALRALGFARISLGVQSLVADELRHVNRRFDFALHDRAIRLIGDAGFPHFNLDLIYGLPGQTAASWERSLRAAIDTPATSLFLYPLYVRPLTGLAARTHSLDAPPSPTPRQMAAMYDAALPLLAAAGFRQMTMRQFRRDPVLLPAPLVGEGRVGEGVQRVVPASPSPPHPPSPPLPQGEKGEQDDEYRCQRHGMVGLGAGARSYTAALHYSTPWRMVARNIRAVVDDYVGRMQRGDLSVSHGFALDEDERRRRFVIQSVLFDGLPLSEFRDLFGADACATFADEWQALVAEGCASDYGDAIRLTARGTRHADIVGQLFFSDRVRRLTADYEYDT